VIGAKCQIQTNLPELAEEVSIWLQPEVVLDQREHCFQIQSAISFVILISFQCDCGEWSGYIVVILPLLAFYFCSAYILYLV
jgi:hypothetical protein